MVDVEVRPAAPPGREVGDEVDECLPLLRAVMGPQGPEPGLRAGGQVDPVDLDEPEEVLQAPDRRPGLAPQRVALEVEEDIALARLRQPLQCVGGEHLEGHRARGVALAGELQPRLGPQPLEGRPAHVGDRPLHHGEVVDRRHAGLDEATPRRHPHPGDEEDVAGLLGLCLARRAAAAGQPARVPPPRRAVVGPVVGEDPVEPGAPGPVGRHDVGQRVLGDRARAEDQARGRGGRDARGTERRGIRGDLEEGRDRVVAGELGVGDEPAGGGALEEVGVADEPAVEEGRLVDDLCVRAQGGEGLVGGQGEAGEVVGRSRELDDPPGMDPGQTAQLALLVRVAQLDDAPLHRVLVGGRPLGPAERDVELANEGELAARGEAQVAGADDQPSVVGEDEHACQPSHRLGQATTHRPGRVVGTCAEGGGGRATLSPTTDACRREPR